MRITNFAIACCVGMAAMSGIGNAQTVVSPGHTTAEDVVTKPLTDMNIKKDEIPPILLAAQDRP